MFRRVTHMPVKYRAFFKRQIKQAQVIGLEKDIDFGPSWMYNHDGEWRTCACAFMNRACVMVHLSWGKHKTWAEERGEFSVTAGTTGPVVYKAYLCAGKVMPGIDRLADLALFGSVQEGI